MKPERRRIICLTVPMICLGQTLAVITTVLVFSANGVEEQPGDTMVCTTTQFECLPGVCIPESWVCDNEIDCQNGKDEAECAEVTACDQGDFRCGNGTCIRKLWVCDGYMDCSDGLDESPELCSRRKCAIDEFECGTSGVCVSGAHVCDGNFDCPGQQDEKNCNNTCVIGEFKCDNNECIQSRWLCDGESDCDNGEDEADCAKKQCKLDEFACRDGTCISKRWRCDGQQDCKDASDEEGCSRETGPQETCKADEFKCATINQCIHSHWKCDKDVDCLDESDESEELCGVNNDCRLDQFRCTSGDCIPIHFKCSHQPECMDGSDEVGCEDELKCDPLTEFDCGPGKSCLPLDRVCDTVNDCGAFEDEPRDKCGGEEKCSISNGGCQQQCIDTPQGHICACWEGFRLGPNNTCVDIDECQIPGSCSQYCENRQGGFNCSCLSGYVQDTDDKTRCVAVDRELGIIFVQKKDIRLTNMRRQETVSLVDGTRAPVGVDFHHEAKQIFWSDAVEHRIYRARLSDKLRTKRVVVDSGAAEGLAVDWIHDNLYWIRRSSRDEKFIAITDFKGETQMDLIRTNLDEPRSLSLHPQKGWMFWSDWGKQAKIEKCGMDGSRRQVLVQDNILWPNGITVDLVSETLYWVDAKLHTISGVGIFTGVVHQVMHSPHHLHHPYSLAVFEDVVYWSDWGLNYSSIYKANKFNGEGVLQFKKSHLIETPMTLKVYHSYTQPKGENLCRLRLDRCSHLCVPEPRAPYLPHNMSRDTAKREASPTTTTLEDGGTTCLCPANLRLAANGAACVEDKTESRQVQWRTSKDEVIPVDNSLFYALIIGITALISVLATLISFYCYKTLWSKHTASDSDDGKSCSQTRGLYQPPLRTSIGKFHESESMVPLRRQSPDSEDLESA